MARTQWGIVYGTSNPHVIAHILPDDDSELDRYVATPGTKLLRMPILRGENSQSFHSRVDTLVTQDASVAQLSSPRFAVVDNNVVVNIAHGDVALNPSPNPNSLHVDVPVTVGLGDTFDPVASTFTTAVPTVPFPNKVLIL